MIIHIDRSNPPGFTEQTDRWDDVSVFTRYVLKYPIQPTRRIKKKCTLLNARVQH